MKPSLRVCRGCSSSKATPSSVVGLTCRPPQQPMVALEYGAFQRAHGWLLELAGLILYCTFLRWNLSFLLTQQKAPACGSLTTWEDLEGIRIKTQHNLKIFSQPTHRLLTQRKSYLEEVSRCLCLALVGLKSYLPQRLRRLSVAALQPVSAGALTFSWLSTGRQ